MKKSTKWFAVAALAASGAFAFACGGGNHDANPPANGSGSAPAGSSAAPAETTSASAASSSAAAPTPAPPLTIVAMKLVAPKAKGPITIKEDGTVEAMGKPVMKFVGNQLQLADGKTIVSVAADGTVTLEGADKTPKFNGKDELEVGDGGKMFVADDGAVKLFNPDGKQDKDSGKLKFTGFKPTARRAATVLVLASMIVGKANAKATTVSSAAPAPKK